VGASKEGTTAGGTTVKLTGTGFLKGAKVKIGGEATSVTVVSATEITAKTVAHAAGKVPVEVSVGGVVSTETVEFTYATTPHVSSISPPEGSKAGGWEALIKGTGFHKHVQSDDRQRSGERRIHLGDRTCDHDFGTRRWQS
jgi:hypothetical protein